MSHMGHISRWQATVQIQREDAAILFILANIGYNCASSSAKTASPNTNIMGTKDPRIDAYIAMSADFAEPILKHIRKLVHAACPDVEETIFSYSHKKEYVQWIAEAKTEETRKRRLATAMGWMAEGKSRHWKYVKC